MLSKKQKRSKYSVAFLLFFALVFSNCKGIQLISKYDYEIDKSITQIQKDMDTHLSRLERAFDRNPEYVTYNNKHQEFYIKMHVDLRSLVIRANSVDKNKQTVSILKLLITELDRLEKRHKNPGLKKNDIRGPRTSFAVGCRGVLKLELAKKRGEEK